MADLGGDGRLHLIIANGGLYPGDLQATEVFRPRKRPGNYLGLRLVGVQSNIDAIGARIALTAGGRTQHRLVSGGSNFGCQPYQQHFGLGEATRIASVEIRWPRGHLQRIVNPPINSTICVTEGEKSP
jgi:hypothetical protein